MFLDDYSLGKLPSTPASVTNTASLNHMSEALLLCQTKQAHHYDLGFSLPLKRNNSVGEKRRR